MARKPKPKPAPDLNAALASLKALPTPMRARIVDLLDDVLWGDYESEAEIVSVAEKKIKPDLAAADWAAVKVVLGAVLPILVRLL